jgi:hypothetical protein
MFAQGLIAKKTAQILKKAFEKTLDPLEMLGNLRTHIRIVEPSSSQTSRNAASRREIILSGYRIASRNSG